MGKFDFEIQVAPEPPDPEAGRAPLQRTPLQDSVTWVTLLPILAAALFVIACGSRRLVAASADLARADDLGRRAGASIAALASDLGSVGHDATTLEQTWRKAHAARLGSLERHRLACRALMLLGVAAFVPAAVVWGRGQFGRPEGAWRIDPGQVGLCSLTLSLVAAGWSWNGQTLARVERLGAEQDLGHQAAAMVAGARAERLAPWRQALNDALAALHPPLAPDANYWCAADVVLHCVGAPEFEMLDGAEKAVLRQALDALTREHYRSAAFEPLARARRPFLGDDGVAALLAEQARETRQFAGDDEKAEYFFEAIRRDNEAEVRMMFRRGIDLNVFRPGPDGGHTPVFAAVAQRRWTLARLLLEHGARPDIGSDPARGPDRTGDFPLHAAVGEPRLVRLLLDHGANPNARNAAGLTPLHLAALAGDRSSIRLLAARKAGLNAPDACGQTPLDLTNDPHASEAARGAHGLLQQLGCLTAADAERAASPRPDPVATTPPQE